MGTTPKVQITDPSMVREVLANNYQFQKPRGGNPLIRTLGAGLTDADGDRWSKHRKIVNPAFHVEKLKVGFPFLMSFSHCTMNNIIFYSIWCLQSM